MTRHEFLRLIAAGSAAPWAGRGPAPAHAAQAPARTFPSGVTAAVTAFITRPSFSDLPDAVVAEAKRCLIDGFGVVLAGSTTRGSAMVREYIGSVASSRRDATVLGRERLSATAAHAALANGASGHAMDYDDTQLSSTPDRVFGLLTHPTVPALASALAVGERAGASGRTVLEAFLVGFEVECKIAEAINPDH
jgi:2-methylcitrate dehydratase PrpD